MNHPAFILCCLAAMLTFDGCVVYADGTERRIGADAITDEFRENLTTFMRRIVSRDPARHVPRVEGDPPALSGPRGTGTGGRAFFQSWRGSAPNSVSGRTTFVPGRRS